MPKKAATSNKDLEAQFNAFLNESLSGDEGVEKYLKPKKKKDKPWWNKDDSSEEEYPDSFAKKTFLKPKKKEDDKDFLKSTQQGTHQFLKPTKAVTPEPAPRCHFKRTESEDMRSTAHDVSMSKDSLDDYTAKSKNEVQKHSTLVERSLEDTDTATPSDKHQTMPGPGLDTLDEQADKERFFKEFEDQTDSTLDYSRLNKKLDMSATPGTTVKPTRDLSDVSDYSDDYQGSSPVIIQVHDSTESQIQSAIMKKPSMLSNVSLMESTMGSSMGTAGIKDTSKIQEEAITNDNMSHVMDASPKSTHTGMACTDTTSQEIAALHKALQEVGMSTLESMHGAQENMPQKGHSYGHDSSTSSQTKGTKDFGMITVSESTEKPARTVEDILREVEEIEQRSHQSVGETSLQMSPKEPLPGAPQSAPQLASQDYHPAKRKSRTKYRDVKSSGYGPSWIPSKAGKQQPWSPADTATTKIKGTQILHQHEAKDVSSLQDSHLRDSVQAFADYIHHHFSTPPAKDKTVQGRRQIISKAAEGAPPDDSDGRSHEKQLLSEINDWKERWKEERKLHTKLKADILSQEKEYSKKLEDQRLVLQDEIFKLKQENFVLSAKVTEDEIAVNGRKRVSQGEDCSGGVSRQQLEMSEKTLKEQEKLIAGYQLENERLYKELKRVETMQKLAEDKMFKENQKLSTVVSQLRQALERRDTELKSRGIITSPLAQQQIAGTPVGSAVLGASRIAELNVELKQSKLQVVTLEENVSRLEESKRELMDQMDLILLNKEQESNREQFNKTARAQEIQEIQRHYEDELDRLNKKLKWYAENQEILDRDNELLKVKSGEIRKLKKQIDVLEKQSGYEISELKSKAKQKETDTKKILDLQRQVREMEGIIKKRHPNSLPALIWAAGMVPDEHQSNTRTVEFLENRNRKLEVQLEEQDEEAKRDLRAMEQKYNAIKYQYEERITFLEKQLEVERSNESHKTEVPTTHPKTSLLALERELDSVRTRYKQDVKNLKEEINNLHKEVQRQQARADAKASIEQRHSRDVNSVLSEQTKALQAALSAKTQELLSLQTNIERLQHEKQILMNTIQRLETKVASISNRVVNKGKIKGKASQVEEEMVLPRYTETSTKVKHYEPESFAGSHIEDVLRENEQLKLKIDHLELQLTQQRIDLNKKLVECEMSARITHGSHEEELVSLKAANLTEIEHLLAQNAAQNSTSKVAQLVSKVDTQEIMIRHLKEQQRDYELQSEQLSVLRIREAALEMQVKNLLDEVKEAKISHSPEMRHFESLLEKIKQMECRHTQRERELKALINQHHGMITQPNLEMELKKWKDLARQKNAEVDIFRKELDSILATLKELQRQGVILPTSHDVKSLKV